MRMPTAQDPLPVRSPNALERAARAAVLGLMRHLASGRLEIVESGRVSAFGPGPGPAVRLEVRDPRFWTSLALSGDVGLGEAYTAGFYASDDLTALLRLLLANEPALEPRYRTLSRLGRAANRVGHLLRANNLRGAKENIAAHYDLSNEMFGLFLDDSMTYSCGLYERPDMTMAEAQAAKRRRLLEWARLSPGMTVLEIGSGWGSLAVDAARDWGVTVRSLTLSEEQLAAAKARAAAAGVADKISFELLDYRKARGRYDRVLSCEMIEAVGHENLPGFFAAVDGLLGPDGLAVIQAITIPDHRYEAYRRGCDWIQKHIFPGAVVPSVTRLLEAATAGSRLSLERLENVGPHYARTLREWRQRFLAAAPQVRALGFGEDFVRAWDYYFSYCEAGFADRQLGDVQFVLSRPGNRSLPGVP
ncbi:MAG: class I SAM-dependent methyltransferase [Elusimicrobia bacterium]|nr:class I SAM-dependent methyltransferase [Elusimicrobiota bacterium]